MLAALLSPHPPALLAFNEPESSLHPDLLEPLARQLVHAGKFSQLWVVTHSQRLAELIEKFSGEAPITLELVGGETRVKGQRMIEESEEEAG
jgi:predicted ATPase